MLQDSASEEETPIKKLWLDADPSGFVWSGLDCDDDLAILSSLALHNQGHFWLKAISVCGGNAPLAHTWPDMQALLKHAGSTIVPYKGYGWRSMQVSRTWLWWLDRFLPDILDSNEASEAVIQATKSDKLTILTLGPPTNLARALEQDATLASRIEHVYMMGGELTNQRLDLNFVSDRAAARAVVQANVPTTIIPIQLCAQVIMDEVFVNSFERDCCPNINGNESNSKRKSAAACALLPKMRQQVHTMPKLINQAVAQRFPDHGRWKPSPNLQNGFIPWDIVAVLAISHPSLFDQWEYHVATFPECPNPPGEPCDRAMVVDGYDSNDPVLIVNHSGIVRIPHVVRNETAALNLMKELMCQVPAHGPAPRMMWGFLGPIFGGIVTPILMLILWKMKRYWW